MRTLLIDNYDSFTFNLYPLLAMVNGAEPLVVRNDELTWAEIEALNVDNIVISPGPGRPERSEDFGVSAAAIANAKVPVLGVCLGHQGIADAFGGEVVLAPEEMHGRISRIRHGGDALFRGLPREFDVVRYHSLLVDATTLPPVLVPTAWTLDGLLMGLRHATRPLFGVQFHPESICSEYGQALLQNFHDLTPKHSQKSPKGKTFSPPTRHPATVESQSPSGVSIEYRCLPWVSPESAFDALYATSSSAFWLDSSSTEQARFSYIGDGSGPLSRCVSYDQSTKQCTLTSRQGTNTQQIGIFDFARQFLADHRAHSSSLPFDFQGGFVGYFGYELKAECGGESGHASPDPDAQLLFCDRLLAFDHQERVLYLVALTNRDAGCEAWMSLVEDRLQSAAQTPQEHPHRESLAGTPYRLARSKARYLEDIQRCLEAIREGESYELCLTNSFHLDASIDDLTLHKELRRRSPAPYAALLRFGQLSIVSSSPERFLRVSPSGAVESKPIKGTRRRGITEAEDNRLSAELATSEKERAENLMIVDLVRNDLARVCEVGSVRVPRLMHVETFASVHQLVSTVVGQLRSSADVIDCIVAAFPGGSMTGAPKRRTMQILDGLETEARGVYSGALGFLSVNGAADLSIAIRCALLRPEGLHVGAGGAIVAQSEPEAEYEEMRLKAQAILEAAAAAAR